MLLLLQTNQAVVPKASISFINSAMIILSMISLVVTDPNKDKPVWL